jgi:hypothetical protein
VRVCPFLPKTDPRKGKGGEDDPEHFHSSPASAARGFLKGVYVTDRINGDGLDNRRENLREATQLQNMHNLQMHHDNTAQYKGERRITTCTWEARLDERTVGYYDTAEDASFAYDTAALAEYGEFAHLNHPIDQVLAWNAPTRQFGRKSANGYRGVQAVGDRWQAEIKHQKRRIPLGFYRKPARKPRLFRAGMNG